MLYNGIAYMNFVTFIRSVHRSLYSKFCIFFKMNNLNKNPFPLG